MTEEQSNHLETQPSTNQEQLASLWVTAQPAVNNYLCAFLPDYHAREEVLQNTAIVLVRKFQSYDTNRPFISWAIGIARLELQKYRTRQNKQRAVALSDELMDAIANRCVEQAGVYGEIEGALDECLKELTERSRKLLYLRYTSGLVTEQIAKQIKAKHSTVRMALYRVRTALRDCINRRISVSRKLSDESGGAK